MTDSSSSSHGDSGTHGSETDLGFANAFDEATRSALIHEDATAWRHVCGLLIAIIIAGLCIGTLAVVICA